MLRRLVEKAWNYLHIMQPVIELSFRKPLVVIQSDDWGLAGIRDSDSFQRLLQAGLPLGDDPYDYYSLETADDLHALFAVLSRHHDSVGNPPALVCNFILANIDFRRAAEDDYRILHLKPLHEGLPEPWQRPGLLTAYQAGIRSGWIYPAMHGLTHFCYPAVEKVLQETSSRAEIQRTMLREGTPFIYPRTPWVGFEFKDEGGVLHGSWLRFSQQRMSIARSVELFRNTFGKSPLSACAPGYRASPSTYHAWAVEGFKVVQNGPGLWAPPFFGSHGLFHLHRNVSFEPAFHTDRDMVEEAFQSAMRSLNAGMPAVISIHSINFHSVLRNYRDATLERLDALLNRLEGAIDGLLYVHDGNLLEIANKGSYTRNPTTVVVRAETKWSLSPYLRRAFKNK